MVFSGIQIGGLVNFYPVRLQWRRFVNTCKRKLRGLFSSYITSTSCYYITTRISMAGSGFFIRSRKAGVKTGLFRS
jgi:hypothetical protein